MPHRHSDFDRACALVQAGQMPQAALLLNTLAARDDALALNMLAELKWGGMLPADPPGARALFERAATAGYIPAAHRVTNLMASGIAGLRDWPRALERLTGEAAADTERARALKLITGMALTADGDPTAAPQGETLSEQPAVRLFSRLFTATECDYLCAIAQAGYQPATVYDSQRRLIRDAMRTSDNSTLHWLIEDPAVHALNRRVAAVSGTGPEQGEAAQILRYRPGQQYRPHFDFVRASDNQRVLTALAYLNHNYRGGETRFVKSALSVKGRKGDVLVFRNALADRQVDPWSEHAGLPVVQGTKFLYSRWIRERRWQP